MSKELVEISFEEEEAPVESWQLQGLKPLHKKVCSFYAQGVKNVDIARMLGITPEYVYVLMKQPVCLEYVAQINQVVGLRLEAMFEQSVDVIADAMTSGNTSERLKGARLQMEATKRIGSGGIPALVSGTEDRLNTLAERLTNLLGKAKGTIYDADCKTITQAGVDYTGE